MLQAIFNLYRRFLFALGILAISRLHFLLLNFKSYWQQSLLEVIMSFFYGIRFDISSCCYLLLPFIIFSFIHAEKSPKFQLFLRILFVFLLTSLFIFNIADSEYYSFSGHRTTWQLLTKSGDTQQHLGRMIATFWHLILFVILLAIFAYRYFPPYKVFKINISPYWAIPLALLTLVLIPLGMRGGWQGKPLLPIDAFAGNVNTAIGMLRLNTPFVIIQTLERKALPTYHDVSEATLKKEIFTPLFSDSTHFPQQNVLIIMLESFGAEYVGFMNKGKGYTPFLDSLAQKGQFFRHAYANGRTSVEGYPSVLIDIPSLMIEPLPFSPYISHLFFETGNYLKSKGYDAAYYHGGQNGTMWFDKMSAKFGFDYYGMNEYGNTKDFDGSWGIWDELYFQYLANQLDKKQKPFVNCVFSLSSHEPFILPPQYVGKFPEGKLPVHRMVGYTDNSLRLFFETAKKQAWYANTLFIITADHTSQSVEPEYQTQLGKFHVPMLLFHPSGKYPSINPEKIVQHCDILPSILDYLDIESDQLPVFGESFFREGEGKAICFDNGKWYYATPKNYVELVENEVVIKNYKDEIQPKTLDDSLAILKVKCYRQYFNERMENNTFMLK